MSDRIWDWIARVWANLDFAFVLLGPASVMGAIFGDALRRDVLNYRQRGVVGLTMSALGLLAGGAVHKEFGFGFYTAGATAMLVAALGTDIVGLAKALLQYAKENPDKIREFVANLMPWGKR